MHQEKSSMFNIYWLTDQTNFEVTDFAPGTILHRLCLQHRSRVAVRRNRG